jgi:hypothetical protein
MIKGSPLRVFCSVALALALAVSTAAAQPTPELDAAEKAYTELEFEKANKMVEAFSRRRGLTHEQLVRTYRLLARTYAILDQEAAARQAFVALLTYAPEEKEDRNLPPKVTERQMEARGILRGYSAQPGIEATAAVNAGEPGVVKVTTNDPTNIIKKVLVGYRWGSMGAYTTGFVGVGVGVQLPVQPGPAGQNRLEFYAQALDERDNVAFEAGSPAAPRAAQAEILAPRQAPPTRTETPASSSSILSSPVFWVVTSVVLIGGGTGLFFALRPRQEEQLPASRAEFRPVILCGAARCN